MRCNAVVCRTNACANGVVGNAITDRRNAAKAVVAVIYGFSAWFFDAGKLAVFVIHIGYAGISGLKGTDVTEWCGVEAGWRNTLRVTAIVHLAVTLAVYAVGNLN